MIAMEESVLWQAYEQGKRALQGQGLSPEEYERRIRQLADALGV